MMSKQFLGFFSKPAKAIAETTLYSVGAAALGNGFYRAGIYVNEKLNSQNQTCKQDEQEQNIQSEIKIGI
ncbi:hypothetical protein OQJ18_07790 [Fluoribacter dumoffii]|uniref:Uncharacterized protein n=1 Tax=Fluoribacter dumoffii TaxID=463 RepID=A0A377G7R9_9GAMM|nr:hypothetical protein [Fluoribacter dumoffii]KTC89750.1 hypothetical protein Ldum_0818 [Fluoribacter dumoffii NY 23]MCW8418006.1 hypothetical protein [Fluoribacter dumoffii]MCW8454152.1 hypothetical protein [Fluoribacter dumoffii]MCW8461774.1 hypothetical protein [Fluoribacter dumoffii]MCW8481990.1 hypothetical protein [Fluoribacter dumoffii]